MSRYDRRTVEQTLPAVWDSEAAYGVRDELRPDADMPKAARDKARTPNLVIHLADVRRAWRLADLSLEEKQALFMRYGLDATCEVVGAYQGVTKMGASRRIERGVGKLTAWLNGADYVDGYELMEGALSQ